MISSTTVYPNLASDMEEADASLSLAADSPYFSDNARIMLQAEQHVIDSNISFVIMRCSGLIGPDRHPSRFAMRLKQVSRKAPANMLHQDDAVSAVKFALDNLSNQVINVTTPHTVSKAEFYQAAINKSESEIPLPQSQNKQISAFSQTNYSHLAINFISTQLWTRYETLSTHRNTLGLHATQT